MYSINGHLLPLERVDSTFIVPIRRNGVKGGRSPFILTLDGEGADTLGRQGKAAASPLAPFRAGGYCGQARCACTGAGWETLLGEHWEQSDLCEG